MKEQENGYRFGLVVLALVLGLLLGAVLGWSAHPSVVEVEKVVEVPVNVLVKVPADCPVVEQVVCDDKVVDEEAFKDWKQDGVLKELALSQLEDDDFIADVSDLLSELNEGSVEDVDDVLSIEVKDLDLSWEDRDNGEASVLVELKVNFLLDGNEDDHSERLNVNFVVNDEDLKEVESWELSEH